MRATAIATILVSTLVPAVATAAESPIAATPGGAAGVITAITALIVALGGLVEAWRSRRQSRRAAERAAAADQRSERAEQRATDALAWADRLASANNDGVVLVISYPGTVTPCRRLLESNEWRVAYYQVTQAEFDAGRLLPGPDMIRDVQAADAIVIEGLDPDHVAQLAAMREFRDRIHSGAGVALYTGGRNHRYDLTLWGECDQGVTTPVTTEAAVRASLARRAATARVQGIRPGSLASAREDLLGMRS